MADRWVCLDVGETLIDETRVWATWADVLGVPRLTFMAALGAVVARGGDHRDVFDIVGVPDWRSHRAEIRGARTAASGRTISTPTRCRRSTRCATPATGWRSSPTSRPSGRPSCARWAFDAEVMAMSDELGVAQAGTRVLRTRRCELMGDPDPADVAYVGDRLDNDVRPAAAAGMRAVWLRRGPWAILVDDAPPPGTLVVASLDELVERIGEVLNVAAAPAA